ncbi:hypothetical protein M422DRAFT_61276 [Sphaerobolus stellatus SS14]|uniref:Uncharacterized protein n=1 Tax=Sphaerobolus stellatus (strain SS14) TaxID=990650 RepID=A0A0C9VDM3_SPHS4|nr:hypothetical protein M422DRAFT_61276 [Sphaerobolus stellatus SS14]
MGAMRQTANRMPTENNAAGFKSTLSPTLDAFFSLHQNTRLQEISVILDRSWEYDADNTLRIIWNLRSIHEGKSAREMFYREFGWLYQRHPRTAIANLKYLVEPYIPKVKKKNLMMLGMSHGYWKDLLNILLLASRDELCADSSLGTLHVSWEGNYRITGSFVLYVSVARLFAEQLARDIDVQRQIADPQTDPERRASLTYRLTLAAKWASNVGGSHGRFPNIATAIADILHASGSLPFQITSSEQLCAQDIPEIVMSTQKWHTIKYSRVPSLCMQINKNRFFKHDEERFFQYLRDVTFGKRKISGGTLLPHTLLYEAIKSDIKEDQLPTSGIARVIAEAKAMTKIGEEVIDAQWKTLVQKKVKESGTLENALAICDVSGTMGSLEWGGPNDSIFPAVALSILLAQVARPPCAVFIKLLLPMAIQHRLKPEDMIMRLCVFSDTQFDNSRTDEVE